MKRYLVKTDGGFPPQPEDRAPAPPELRKSKRAHMPGYVYIHDDLRLYIAPLSDISAGGLFLKLLTAIPRGSAVKLVIKSPRLEHPIQAKGTVVRVESKKRRGLAVQFGALSADEKALIQECIQELSNDELLQVIHAN